MKPILWVRGRSPPWPGFADGLGADTVTSTVDATSMKDVRQATVEVQPSAIVYAGWRDPMAAEMDPDLAFLHGAEAPIGVAAAAMEMDAVAVLVSHPAVFGGRGGPWSEADTPRPESRYGEALHRGEVFLGRAAKGRSLVIRAGPVLGSGLEAERRALIGGAALVGLGRRLTPVSDFELGRSIRFLVEREVRGVVHVAGEATDGLDLWRAIAERARPTQPLKIDELPQEPGSSWALAVKRLEDLGLVRPGWREVLEDLWPSAREPAAAPTTNVYWRGDLPSGATDIAGGLRLLRLEAGTRSELIKGVQLLVRSGKVLLELEDDDIVLRAGQGLTLPSTVQAVAVDGSELIVVEGSPG